MKQLFIIVLLAISTTTFAQDEMGFVNIIASSNIDALVNKHVNMNRSSKPKKGFRIQLIQNSVRQNVLDRKEEFLMSFPEIPIYMNYAAPYFKLRVGDYNSRLEAYRALKQILYKIPTAFIVPDYVKSSSF